MTTVRTLTPVDATPETVAPFGRLVGAGADGGRGTAFYDSAVELWDAPGLVNDADVSLSVARIHPRAPRVIWMERHFKHTQLFLPLGGAPFIMVLAPPTAGGQPEADAVRALRFDGRAGMMLGLGVWHEFPFAIDRPADIAVLLRHETNRDLDAIADGEAVGGDLEKRNIARRLGIEFRVAIAS
jgi:ureidoglycolate lyase